MNTLRVDQAFRTGDLAVLREEISPEFPRGEVPSLFSPPLEYAIYHSPLSFLRSLIELGADPNYTSEGGFPSLIAALSTERRDKLEVVALLLAAGADVNQRGLNDWTPLHCAASRNDPAAIQLLASHGADLHARTRIDNCATPREEAEILKQADAVEALKMAEEAASLPPAPGTHRSGPAA
jgi:ankyrin repeat protein